MISQSVLNAMIEVAALSFVMPVGIALVWKMYNRISISPVFVGAAVFIGFGVLLKSVPDMFFLSIDSPVSRFINSHPFVYAAYAGLAAAVFEEAGRFVAFRFFLSRHGYRECAVSYGLGHGGVECIAVLGFSYIQNFMYAQLINAGSMDEIYSTLPSEEAVDAFKAMAERISNISVSDCVWESVEGLSSMVVQVSLSIIVFKAVVEAGKMGCLAIAALLHALFEFILSLGGQLGLSAVFTQAILLAYAAGVAFFAYKQYRGLPAAKKEDKKPVTDWGYASRKYSDIKRDSDDVKEPPKNPD